MAGALALGCGADLESAQGRDAAPSDARPTAASVRHPSRVVTFTKGEKGGFNEEALPEVIQGPPQGGGCCAGSTDVLSLGDGGEIVLAFDVTIVDQPGTDFIVFENAFEYGSTPEDVVAEPAEVAVSDDGVTWTAFPCTATAWPYGTCAGWHPVHATAASPLDPLAPEKAGGDPFDLAAIGVTRARFIRIRDMNRRFPAAAPTAGFDLDGVAVLHFQP